MATEQTVVPADQVRQLADYIQRAVIRRPGVEIADDTPLVSSGLIDSFALIEIFLELEKVTNRKIPVGKVRAKDMDTLRLMFAMAEKMGKPKT
jgi:acyl carrier protein